MKRYLSSLSTCILVVLAMMAASTLPLVAPGASSVVAATTSATTVSVVVEGVNLYNLKINNSQGPIETFNATNTLSFDVIGAGMIEVVDQNGNILFSHNKTTSGAEHISTSIDLIGGIGTHVLTASISDGNNTISQDITIIYKELPIIPPLPGGGTDTDPDADAGIDGSGVGAPSSGWMIYIHGYAVPVFGVAMWAILLAVVAYLIFLGVKARRKHRRDGSGVTTNAN